MAEPAFVFGCGDVTEWPTHAAKDAYDKLITGRLKFPSYDILGNHDTGGKVPSDTMSRWIIARHGSLTYTFDRGGVHFVALYSEYDENLNSPAQPITSEALDFLRKHLAGLPEGQPVVVATHLCFDAITNRDALVESFGRANVILVLGGHYHKAVVSRFRGIHFLSLLSFISGLGRLCFWLWLYSRFLRHGRCMFPAGSRTDLRRGLGCFLGLGHQRF